VTTEVLLDTNTYLRLAKRIRPAVGRQFGQVPYVLVILKVVEDEVHQSSKLRFNNPWFDEPEFAQERFQAALSAADKAQIELVKGPCWALADLEKTPQTLSPGRADCWLLAYGQVKEHRRY
jgi:hypothetical protein